MFVVTASLSMIGSFLFCGASAARAFRIQVPVYFFAMLVASLGSAILIPHYGMPGAAISLLLSAATIVLAGLLVMRKILHQQRRQLP